MSFLGAIKTGVVFLLSSQAVGNNVQNLRGRNLQSSADCTKFCNDINSVSVPTANGTGLFNDLVPVQTNLYGECNNRDDLIIGNKDSFYENQRGSYDQINWAVGNYTLNNCTSQAGAPTVAPTPLPTIDPTADPTAAPTVAPTPLPTIDPTADPTAASTVAPTPLPTIDPTVAPTLAPGQTLDPTVAPTPLPTIDPTVAPTAASTSDSTPSSTSDSTAASTSDSTPSSTPDSTPSSTTVSTPSSTTAAKVPKDIAHEAGRDIVSAFTGRDTDDESEQLGAFSGTIAGGMITVAGLTYLVRQKLISFSGLPVNNS